MHLRGIAAARQIDVDRADALLLQPVDVVLQGLGPLKSATLDRVLGIEIHSFGDPIS